MNAMPHIQGYNLAQQQEGGVRPSGYNISALTPPSYPATPLRDY